MGQQDTYHTETAITEGFIRQDSMPPIMKPMHYQDHHGLHRARTFFALFQVINFFSKIYKDGFLSFAESFYFFTVWTEACICFYHIFIVLGFPHTHKRSKIMVNIQHAFLMQESIVVLVFWGILFPYLGLDGGGKGEGKYFKYMMVYKHTVPFIAMFHDFFCSHGDYSKTGTYICIGIYIAYYIFNQILQYGFDIIVYDTPLTNGSSWISYAGFIVTFPIFYGVGVGFGKWKQARVKKEIERAGGE